MKSRVRFSLAPISARSTGMETMGASAALLRSPVGEPMSMPKAIGGRSSEIDKTHLIDSRLNHHAFIEAHLLRRLVLVLRISSPCLGFDELGRNLMGAANRVLVASALSERQIRQGQSGAQGDETISEPQLHVLAAIDNLIQRAARRAGLLRQGLPLIYGEA